MKKSTKILAGAALLASMVGLSGCGAIQTLYGSPPPSPTETPQQQVVETSEPTLTSEPTELPEPLYGPPNIYPSDQTSVPTTTPEP